MENIEFYLYNYEEILKSNLEKVNNFENMFFNPKLDLFYNVEMLKGKDIDEIGTLIFFVKVHPRLDVLIKDKTTWKNFEFKEFYL